MTLPNRWYMPVTTPKSRGFFMLGVKQTPPRGSITNPHPAQIEAQVFARDARHCSKC